MWAERSETRWGGGRNGWIGSRKGVDLLAVVAANPNPVPFPELVLQHHINAYLGADI